MKFILFSFFIILSFNSFSQSNQKIYTIIKYDNIQYTGKILEDNGREILIETSTVGKIYLPKTDIKIIKLLNKNEEINNEKVLDTISKKQININKYNSQQIVEEKNNKLKRIDTISQKQDDININKNISKQIVEEKNDKLKRIDTTNNKLLFFQKNSEKYAYSLALHMPTNDVVWDDLCGDLSFDWRAGKKPLIGKTGSLYFGSGFQFGKATVDVLSDGPYSYKGYEYENRFFVNISGYAKFKINLTEHFRFWTSLGYSSFYTNTADEVQISADDLKNLHAVKMVINYGVDFLLPGLYKGKHNSNIEEEALFNQNKKYKYKFAYTFYISNNYDFNFGIVLREFSYR